MDNEVDVAKLIHKGGSYRDVEGETPQEIYKKMSKMIDLPDCMTS